MLHERLTSLELHLDFAPGAIIETRSLEDTACGCHPSYYRARGDRLLVSTSAATLIAQSGGLEPNPAFRPRNYLAGATARDGFVAVTGGLPGRLKDWLKARLPLPLLRRLARDRFWYESWETMDVRVRKLRPFELRTPDGSTSSFAPDFTLTDPEDLAVRVARGIADFIRDIEQGYPRHTHVVLLGGRDSQLIALAPKLRPAQWHIFSAEPNAPLNRAWLAENGVAMAGFDTHDNRNEETPGETREKIVASDLYSDPRHMRWLPTLRRIAARWPAGCFFWAGTAPCAMHEGRHHHRRLHGADPKQFFDPHLTRVPSLMGNYHQVVKNFTGCALLSPYHGARIWREAYMRYGPATIPPGTDLRVRIGELLAGRAVHWLAFNPGPRPYAYNEPVDARAVYLRALEARRQGAAP